MSKLDEARLQADLQEAMRGRDMTKVYVLRGVIAAIKNLKVEKQSREELPEADVLALLRKEVSKRVEALGFAEKAGRSDAVAQNQAEKAILDAYLPAQMDAAQLEAEVARLSAELGTTQIGPLMAALKERHAGLYDGKLASELIRKLPPR